MAAAITSLFRGGDEPRSSKRRRARGRDADKPTQIPPRGWLDVLKRVKVDVKEDDATLLAAGVAFYALLALVPALVALVSVYGLVADPADIQRNVEDVLAAAPTEVRDLVSQQLSSIVESSPSGLRVGAIVGLALALWSASAGVKNLMAAVNRAYHEHEERGFVKLRGTALMLTLGLVIIAALGMGAFLGPKALDTSGTVGVVRDVALIARWPVVAVLFMAALALIYRFAPNRDNPRWAWASQGAVFAVVLFAIASVAFSFYTANFGKYNETYGALGAIVVVMLWLWIGALSIIMGAEINGESERQTLADTTTGSDAPLGERDAYAADTVGPSADELAEKGER